jgi:hypothetical protein
MPTTTTILTLSQVALGYCYVGFVDGNDKDNHPTTTN